MHGAVATIERQLRAIKAHTVRRASQRHIAANAELPEVFDEAEFALRANINRSNHANAVADLRAARAAAVETRRRNHIAEDRAVVDEVARDVNDSDLREDLATDAVVHIANDHEVADRDQLTVAVVDIAEDLPRRRDGRHRCAAADLRLGHQVADQARSREVHAAALHAHRINIDQRVHAHQPTATHGARAAHGRTRKNHLIGADRSAETTRIAARINAQRVGAAEQREERALINSQRASDRSLRGRGDLHAAAELDNKLATIADRERGIGDVNAVDRKRDRGANGHAHRTTDGKVSIGLNRAAVTQRGEAADERGSRAVADDLVTRRKIDDGERTEFEAGRDGAVGGVGAGVEAGEVGRAERVRRVDAAVEDEAVCAGEVGGGVGGTDGEVDRVANAGRGWRDGLDAEI